MRQVFYSSPWIHEPEPEELFRIYAANGTTYLSVMQNNLTVLKQALQ